MSSDKVAGFFHWRRDSGRYRTECKSCQNSKSRTWRKSHREHVRTYCQANRQKIRQQARQRWPKYKEYNKKWREENCEWVNERMRKYRAKHPERFREYERKRYSIHHEKRRTLSSLVYQRRLLTDPEKFKEQASKRGREWVKKNPRKQRDRVRRWALNNRDKIEQYQFRRRSRLRKGRCDLTSEQWEQIKSFYDYRCAFCRRRRQLTKDHFVPVSKGGEHTAANIIPLCISCNCSKGSRKVTKTFQPHLLMGR